MACPDGQRLASASKIGEVKIWDTTSGQVVRTFAEIAGGPAVAWSSDGKRLASVGANHVIKLHSPADGKELATLTGHTNKVTSLAWNPKGDRLASASRNGTFEVWDPSTGNTVLNRGLGATQFAGLIAWSPEGGRLAVVETGDGLAKILDA